MLSPTQKHLIKDNKSAKQVAFANTEKVHNYKRVAVTSISKLKAITSSRTFLVKSNDKRSMKNEESSTFVPSINILKETPLIEEGKLK